MALTDEERIIAARRALVYPPGVPTHSWFCGEWKYQPPEWAFEHQKAAECG